MTNLSRTTAKIFGETASTTGNDPEIGQFGSAKVGTYLGTNDVATIQSLPAWSNGWIDAVTPTHQFPTLPERTAVDYVQSYQNAYLMQKGVAEWDSGTTYYTGDFAKGVGEGKLYVSKVDNNLNHAVTDGAYWDEFTSGGASRNIGEIVTSTIPLTDAGLHLLDGALISGSGSYADFVEYIGDLYDSGDYPDLFDTEANWQTAVTTYGVCGKFVYDVVNNTVRLPKITGIIEGTTDLTALGDLVEAGLPNITGGLGEVLKGADEGGAFYNISQIASNRTYSNGSYPSYNTGLNASLSSSIYGNSNTVQPQTIKVLYYIVIATTTKTDIEVDIDEVATDLNGKADVDGSNITTYFSTSLVNNMSDTANIYMSKMGMPSSTYTDLTLGASGSTYTAPANGWFVLRKKASANNQYLNLQNLSSYIISKAIDVNGAILGVSIPSKKGDIVATYYSTGGATDMFRFVYAQGSESEAQ